MNELQVFKNSEFGEIGVLTIDGKEYFPATACAKILGYSNPQKAVRDHCLRDGCTNRSVIDNLGRTQEMKFITEGNLYRLIVRSKLPAAEKFERWVFDEVLPTIRKQGHYSAGEQLPLDKVMEIVQLTATTILTEFVKQITPILRDIVATSSVSGSTAPGCTPARTFPPYRNEYMTSTRCKLETFPEELQEQVDEMLGDMLQQQALNFSMIARYCTMSGYPISQPSVKRYFMKYHSEE